MLDVMSMYVKNVTIAPGLPYVGRHAYERSWPLKPYTGISIHVMGQIIKIAKHFVRVLFYKQQIQHVT